MTSIEIIQNVQKFIKLTYFFYFTSFLLLFESITLLLYGTGILSVNLKFIEQNTGALLLGISLYALMSSAIVYIADLFISSIAAKCSSNQVSHHKNYIDEVSLYEQAIIEKDKFKLDILDRHKKVAENYRLLRSGAILFIITFSINAFYKQSIVSKIIVQINQSFLVAGICLVLLLSMMALLHLLYCLSTDQILFPIKEEKPMEISPNDA